MKLNKRHSLTVKRISPAYSKLMLGEVFVMPKFELSPYITSQNIGEIEVSVELTKEEVELCRKMSKEEFSNYIKPKATVIITDFDVDYEPQELDDWDEVE